MICHMKEQVKEFEVVQSGLLLALKSKNASVARNIYSD